MCPALFTPCRFSPFLQKRIESQNPAYWFCKYKSVQGRFGPERRRQVTPEQIRHNRILWAITIFALILFCVGLFSLWFAPAPDEQPLWPAFGAMLLSTGWLTCFCAANQL